MLAAGQEISWVFESDLDSKPSLGLQQCGSRQAQCCQIELEQMSLETAHKAQSVFKKRNVFYGLVITYCVHMSSQHTTEVYHQLVSISYINNNKNYD